MTALRSHQQILPKSALYGAAALIGAALLLVGAARLGGYDSKSVPDAPAVASRDLTFEDRADGAVVVRASDDDGAIGLLAPGTNGFARGVLRGLVRERTMAGLGDDAPFRLTRFANGDLWLTDLATGRQIYLAAFGPTNAGAFAAFLPAEDAAP
jgi:putative photosynthetic complex assembly protein